MSYVALDIFEQLRPEDVHWLLASAEIKAIAADRVLVREDDPSETIFFVADGLFEVYVFAGSGSSLKVGQLGPGDVIGEISWLDKRPISASVRALEASSVMALSTAALERRLAEDPKFAARFFRGIATLTAERLRKTTSDLRRAQWAAGSPAATDSSAEAKAIGQRIDAFKALSAAVEARASSGGTVADGEAKLVRDAFDALALDLNPVGGKSLAGITDALHAGLLPYIQRSAVGQRCLTKPRGYVGDYRTIAMIYGNSASGEAPLGPILDAALLNQAAMKAIRNQRAQAAAELTKLFEGSAKEFHVTSLGSGPASEIFDVYDKATAKGRLLVNCVDVDREALAHVATRAQDQGLAGQIRTYQANLIHLATGQQALDLAPQDVIYSLFFADSLSDEMTTTLINWMHDKLRPGGRVLLGAFDPSNPTRGLMDHVLDWHVVHRSEADLNRVFQASRFAKPCTRILKDSEGIGLLAECVK